MGHWQTLQTKIRRHIMWHRIRDYIVCWQDFSFKKYNKWRNRPDTLKMANGLVQLITVEESTSIQCINGSSIVFEKKWKKNAVLHLGNRKFSGKKGKKSGRLALRLLQKKHENKIKEYEYTFMITPFLNGTFHRKHCSTFSLWIDLTERGVD